MILTEAQKKQLDHLAADCIRASHTGQRAESLWLKNRCARFYEDHHFTSREACDAALYERTFGEPAQKSSAPQKIRYWRTGRFYPRNRQVCEAFGRALELSEEEQNRLMTAWFDRCDRVFDKTSPGQPVYEDRLRRLRERREEFLQKIPPRDLWLVQAPGTAPEQNLRHLYCLKAADLLYFPHQGSRRMTIRPNVHFDSQSYDNRFTREMALFGDISRKTMIRHLVILSLPFLNVELLSHDLSALGYLPLTEEHTTVDGAACDRLLIGLLRLYEESCSGESPLDCDQWFRNASAWLDRVFQTKKEPDLRIFNFKYISGRME